MTPESQRIAIAGACPAVLVRAPGAEGWNYYNSTVGRILSCIDGDPRKDLNAMREAEKILDQGSRTRYIFNLQTICGGGQFGDNYFATASQRAEAFLKTLNLWVCSD